MHTRERYGWTDQLVITMKSFLYAHSGRYGWTDQTVTTMKSFLYAHSGRVWMDRPDCDHTEIISVCTLGNHSRVHTRERYEWTDQTVITMKSFLYAHSGEVWVDRPRL